MRPPAARGRHFTPSRDRASVAEHRGAVSHVRARWAMPRGAVDAVAAHALHGQDERPTERLDAVPRRTGS